MIDGGWVSPRWGGAGDRPNLKANEPGPAGSGEVLAAPIPCFHGKRGARMIRLNYEEMGLDGREGVVCLEQEAGARSPERDFPAAWTSALTLRG